MDLNGRPEQEYLIYKRQSDRRRTTLHLARNKQATKMFSSTIVLCVLVLVGVAHGQPGGGPMPGGRNPVASNDETVLDLAEFAVSGICSEYTLGEILSAESQVVTGSKYYISASMTKTDAHQATTTMHCDFEVLLHFLAPLKRLLSFSCTSV